LTLASPSFAPGSTALGDAACALQRAAEQLTCLPTRGPEGQLYHQTLAALHGLLACAAAAAEAGVPYPEMRAATAEARAFHGRHSRTLAHTQSWPRGYPPRPISEFLGFLSCPSANYVTRCLSRHRKKPPRSTNGVALFRPSGLLKASTQGEGGSAIPGGDLM